jgi:hypothetical protein
MRLGLVIAAILALAAALPASAQQAAAPTVGAAELGGVVSSPGGPRLASG